jgi:two-component system phosphate regulon sensor histidine kinase PhoR
MTSIQTRTALASLAGGMLVAAPIVLVALADESPASWLLWLALVCGALLGGCAGWIASTRNVRELNDLTGVTNQATAGHLSVSVDPVATREINDLGRAINRLIARFGAAQHRTAQEQRWVEAIFDGMQDGVMLVDADEQVISANHRSAAMLGASQDVSTGQRLMVLARDYELVAQYREVMSSGETSTRTVQHLRSGRAIEITVLPVETEGERFGLIVLRDVTELRRLEAVRREFVANVSHELKTPLASIRALADTLEAGAIDDPRVSGDFLARIVFEVDRLNALVDELLDLGRLESGRLALDYRPTEPSALIRSAVDRLRHQIDSAGLTIEVDAPATLPTVPVDPARMEQVLINLIQNAIKFTPAGGSIRVRAAAGNSQLRIDVTDTGVGIHEDELPRVFERFYKSDRARRSTGTGLGLAIAKHIVLAHRGDIGVQSMPGRGSTFTIRIPIAAGQPAPSATGSATA